MVANVHKVNHFKVVISVDSILYIKTATLTFLVTVAVL
jgi:hypothetical protein